MDPIGIEAVPTVALGALPVPLEIELVLFVDHIVLAGDVVHVETGLRDCAVGVVEFLDLGQVRDVARVNHERRLDR